LNAPREKVYRALLDAGAVAQWMVPTGMTSHVHAFDARESGFFRISLTYDAPDARGKSSAHTDTYHGRFTKLIPNEQVVRMLEFETEDPAIRGEMTITIALSDADGGTELVALHENLPPGVPPADNELGRRLSLDKLAALVEAGCHGLNPGSMNGNNKTESVRQDLLASVVVCLVALPLCMGIAIASGVPPAAGLITGIAGGLVAGALSGCPLQVSGPAAGLAVIVYEMVQKYGLAGLGPIIVLAGIFQFAAGLLKAGQFFRAIAPAVIYGMLAGIGVLIFGAQFHVMVDDKPRASGIENLLSIPSAIQKGILPVDGSSHHLAAFLGVATIVILLGWSKFAPRKLKWIPGALVAVAVSTMLAQVFALPVRRVNLPDSLLGSIQLPSLGAFQNIFQLDILIAALTIAFVASAETLLSATAVDQMHDGPRTQYDKELRAQGVGNIVAGLIGGIPMTGVIVRSATNVAAGARTRASAMFHGLWLLLLVAAFPFVLRMVPTASLAAVLVYTGYKLVNPQNVKNLLHYGGAPVFVYAATLVTIIFTDLLTGILTGLGLSVLKVLYGLTHMEVRIVRGSECRIDVHISGAATFIRMPGPIDSLNALPRDIEIHLRFEGLSYIDHACMEAISSWERKRSEKGARVVVGWNHLMARYRQRNRFLRSPEFVEAGWR
jgi:MFS superfamily sulfate permease-like transporter/uncharacterized protein YndB with AHSA1/START domain